MTFALLRASITAASVAFLRACAGKPDTLARIFFPGPARLLLTAAPITLPAMRWLLPGLYEYIHARTLLFDVLFTQALAAAVAQIVLLGAGYDTRAYRFAAQLGATRVFELDAPATQARKRRCLARASVAIPAGVQFIPCALGVDDLAGALAAAGFDAGQQSLFLWEGVTMYLTAADVGATLTFVGRCAPGSAVAFDYVHPAVVGRQGTQYGAQEVVRAVRWLGEPYRFGMERVQLEALLAASGLSLRVHYTPAELQRIFLPNLKGRMAAYCYNVAAEVASEE